MGKHFFATPTNLEVAGNLPNRRSLKTLKEHTASTICLQETLRSGRKMKAYQPKGVQHVLVIITMSTTSSNKLIHK
jgi:hypothetical protein